MDFNYEELMNAVIVPDGDGLTIAKSEPTPQRGDRTCDCWVSKYPAEETFSIRNGAHNPECPVFRPSKDPVDAYHDAGLRMREETGIQP